MHGKFSSLHTGVDESVESAVYMSAGTFMAKRYGKRRSGERCVLPTLVAERSRSRGQSTGVTVIEA